MSVDLTPMLIRFHSSCILRTSVILRISVTVLTPGSRTTKN